MQVQLCMMDVLHMNMKQTLTQQSPCKTDELPLTNTQVLASFGHIVTKLVGQ